MDSLPKTDVAIWDIEGILRTSSAVVGQETATFEQEPVPAPGNFVAYHNGTGVVCFRVVRVTTPKGLLVAGRTVASLQALENSGTLDSRASNIQAQTINIKSEGTASQAGIDSILTQAWHLQPEVPVDSILRAIDQSELAAPAKDNIRSLAENHRRSTGSKTITATYLSLMAALADHKEVLEPSLPWLAPVLETLRQAASSLT